MAEIIVSVAIAVDTKRVSRNSKNQTLPNCRRPILRSRSVAWHKRVWSIVQRIISEIYWTCVMKWKQRKSKIRIFRSYRIELLESLDGECQRCPCDTVGITDDIYTTYVGRHFVLCNNKVLNVIMSRTWNSCTPFRSTIIK